MYQYTHWISAAGEMSSAPRDDYATIPPSISMPRYVHSFVQLAVKEGSLTLTDGINLTGRWIDVREEEGDGAIASRMNKITYSRELLLAVGSLETCKVLPAGVGLSKHPG